MSIEKPGECMALLPGCSYSVETVTSGHLMWFECYVTLYCFDRDDCNGSDVDANGCEVDDQGGNVQENTGNCGNAAENVVEIDNSLDGVNDGDDEDDYDSIYTRASELNMCLERKEVQLQHRNHS